MTDTELRERCSYWQRILRLQDWKVNVRFAASGEVDGQDAKCRVHQQSKVAVIRISKPESHDTTSEFYTSFQEDYDPELMLLHELLHIPFDSIIDDEPDEHKGIAQEQAIEFIAQALLSLERKA